MANLITNSVVVVTPIGSLNKCQASEKVNTGHLFLLIKTSIYMRFQSHLNPPFPPLTIPPFSPNTIPLFLIIYLSSYILHIQFVFELIVTVVYISLHIMENMTHCIKTILRPVQRFSPLGGVCCRQG